METKINKQNYEQYLIDLMDGNIEQSMKEKLLVFLTEHPEIKEEFEDLNYINTAFDNDIKFEHKNELKKPLIIPTKNIHEKNYEEFFVASIEDDLLATQKIELDHFIKINPNLSNTYELYKQCKIKVDTSLTFPNKKLLKKFPFYKKKTFYFAISAAACIIFLLNIFTINKEDKNRPFNVAQHQTVEIFQKMKYRSVKEVTYNISNPIFIQYRNISIPKNSPLNDLIFSNEKFNKLQARINLNDHFDLIKSYQQIPIQLEKNEMRNYTSYSQEYQQEYDEIINNDKKNKISYNLSWKNLFAQFKNTKRKIEGSIEEENKKQVGPIWILTNIGLERVNEITGTNFKLNSKTKEHITENKKYTNFENTYPTN